MNQTTIKLGTGSALVTAKIFLSYEPVFDGVLDGDILLALPLINLETVSGSRIAAEFDVALYGGIVELVPGPAKCVVSRKSII